MDLEFYHKESFSLNLTLSYPHHLTINDFNISFFFHQHKIGRILGHSTLWALNSSFRWSQASGLRHRYKRAPVVCLTLLSARSKSWEKKGSGPDAWLMDKPLLEHHRIPSTFHLLPEKVECFACHIVFYATPVFVVGTQLFASVILYSFT